MTIKNKEFLLSCNNNLNEIKFIPINSDVDNHTITKGKLNPIDGWFSNRYGEKIPAAILRINSKVELPAVSGAAVILDTKIESKIYSYNFTTHNQKVIMIYGNISYSIVFNESGELNITENENVVV